MPLPRTLAIAVERLGDMGQSDCWAKFAVIGKQNVIRHLKRRYLVADIGEKYQDGEEWTGPKPSRYVLTPQGEEAYGEIVSKRKPK